MMADDFDSEMLSSTSSSPSAKSIPQTPAGDRLRDNISGVTMPELSPPGSQDPATQEATMMGYNENLKESTTSTGFSMSHDMSEELAEGSTSQLPSVLREEPGASWTNKKADEEAKRALEFVVDKEFSLNEFGDPFDDRDINPAQTK